jgi:hypothetical protein
MILVEKEKKSYRSSSRVHDSREVRKEELAVIIKGS